MAAEEVEAFLAKRLRLATLSSVRRDGTPVAIPVWFDWDGEQVRIFCGADSTKLTRIGRDPRISVLVSADTDEPEYWVAFDGVARIEDRGGAELAELLAHRYWDLEDPQKAEVLAEWRSVGDEGLRVIALTPSRIRQAE